MNLDLMLLPDLNWFSSLLHIILLQLTLGHCENFQCSSPTTEDHKISSCPKIISREEWGARPPKSIVEMKLPVNYAIVHHSVTGVCSTTEECTKVLQAIQNFHMDERGWDDIGYTFLVGGDGNIYEGRGWNRTGAHAPGYNDKSIGICIIGNFMEHLPVEGQLTATKTLIACGVSKDFIKSDYILYGHRDVRATQCPGDALYKEISTWPHKGQGR